MANATNTTPGSIALSGDLSGSVDPYKPELRPTGVLTGSYGNTIIEVNSEGRVIQAVGQSLTNMIYSYIPLLPATTTQAGFVTVPENGYIDINANGEISLPRATQTEIGVVSVQTSSGLTVTNGAVGFDLNFIPPATTTTLGLVRVPTSGRLVVDDNGNISVPIADANTFGIVKVGTNLTVNTGTVNIAPPIATSTTSGAISFTSQFKVINTDELVVDQQGLPSLTANTFGFPQFYASTFNAPDGVLTPRLASTTNQGIVQIGDGLTVANGVTSVVISLGNTNFPVFVKSSNTVIANTGGALTWNTNNYNTFVASNSIFGFVKPDGVSIWPRIPYRLEVPSDPFTYTRIVRDITEDYIFCNAYDVANTSQRIDIFTHNDVVGELQLANSIFVEGNITFDPVAYLTVSGDEVAVFYKRSVDNNYVLKFYTNIPNLVQTQSITINNFANRRRFAGIKIDGDICVIGEKENDFTSSPGKLIIYQKISGTWQYVTDLIPGDVVYGDRFLGSRSKEEFNVFDMSGNTIVACERTQDSSPLTSESYLGAVYVYTRSGNTWSMTTKLTPSYPYASTPFTPTARYDDEFFGRVSISNNEIIITGRQNWLNYPTTPGGVVAYRYKYVANNWVQQPSILLESVTPQQFYYAAGDGNDIVGNTVICRYSNSVNPNSTFKIFTSNNETQSWDLTKTYQQPGQSGGVKLSPNENFFITLTEFFVIDELPLVYEEPVPGLISLNSKFLQQGTIKGSNTEYGVIQIGNNLTANNGVISVDPVLYKITSNTQLGVVRIGDNITYSSNGLIFVPFGSNTEYGVIQIGTGLSVTNGVISFSPNFIPFGSTTEFGRIRASPINNTVVNSSNNFGVILPAANVATNTAGAIFVDNTTFTVNTNNKLSATLANGNTFGLLIGNTSSGVVINNGYASCSFDLIPRTTVIEEAANNTFEKAQVHQPVIANTTSTIEPNFANTNIFIYTLTTNTHFEQPNTDSILVGDIHGSYVMILKQDSVGGRIATWDPFYAFDSTPILSTNANAVDIVMVTLQKTEIFQSNAFSILTKNYS
jgi:hypothetical protein